MKVLQQYARAVVNVRAGAPARATDAPAGVAARPREAAGRTPGTAVLLAIGVFVLLAALRPLLLPDEGRYAGVAWEMLRSGDWVTPTLDGLPFFHKPPLYYWITAAAMAVLGPSELAARCAPLAGAGLAVAACLLFLRRWAGARAAHLVAVGLLVQPLFALGAQFANLDMLVAGCITATILLAAHAVLARDAGLPHRRALAGAYAAAALGVLAKGLIGAVIPVLVIGAWLLLLRRWQALRALVWAPGLALFLVLALPWFAAAEWLHPGFLDYSFVVQHLQRFAAGGFNNVEPAWFYPALLAALALPWLPWLRAGLVPARLRAPHAGPVRVLLWVWAALVTLFFSLPESKLVGYVLPAVPPLAMLAAEACAEPSPRVSGWLQRWGWPLAAVGGFVLTASVALGLTLHPLASSRELAGALRAQRAAGELVVMLDQFYFDVPFYAHLQRPVLIVDAWTDPTIAQHDNWRKELADGARFAPVRAEAVLVTPEHLAATLCAAPVAWVIGAASAPARYAFLADAHDVASARGTTLWRVDATGPRLAARLGCAP